MNHLKISLVFFVLLAGVTLACHYWIAPYQTIGGSLLDRNWQVYSGKGQTARHTDDVLNLSNTRKDATVRIFQDIYRFKPGDKLRLSARVKVENVVPGKDRWNRARLLLMQNDGKKNRGEHPHQAAVLKGTEDWEAYQLVVPVAHDTKKIRVRAELTKCTGSMTVKDIRLNRVIPVPGNARAQKFILSAWAIYLLFYLAGFLDRSKASWMLNAMIIVFTALIIIGTTLPSKTKRMVSKQISHQIEKTTGEKTFYFTPFLPKIGHFIFFLLFGGCLRALQKNLSISQMLCYILILAGGTETAQLFVEGRAPLFFDFFLDILGGLFGIATIFFLIRSKASKV